MFFQQQTRFTTFGSLVEMYAAPMDSGDYAYVVENKSFYHYNGTDKVKINASNSFTVLGTVDFTASEPVSPNLGDRYINTTTGSASTTAQAITTNNLLEWNGSTWVEVAPENGEIVFDVTSNEIKHYNVSTWDNLSSNLNHKQSFLTGDWVAGAPNTYTIPQSTHNLAFSAGDIYHVTVTDTSGTIILVQANISQSNGDVILSTSGSVFDGIVLISK